MVSKTNKKLIAQSKALEQITEHNRDYLSLSLSLPLGNTALKKVHTNQWLFTNLPKEFDLANWTILADALSSGTNRNIKYIKNKWYIEGVEVEVNKSGNSEMKLDVNAFASSRKSYTDNFKSLKKAYKDATKKQTSNKNKTKAVTKKKGNSTLKGGEGKFIDDLVKKIVGKETNDLKKAKKIHKHLCGHLHYTRYSCSRLNTPRQVYEKKNVNCADTSRLTASMFRSAGLKCYVVHSTCHFYTVMEYKGKQYCSDATSSKRPFNTYWKATKQGNECKGVQVKFKGKSSYYNKDGKNPSC